MDSEPKALQPEKGEWSFSLNRSVVQYVRCRESGSLPFSPTQALANANVWP